VALLEVRNLHIQFPAQSSGFFKRTQSCVRAVDNVSFDLQPGEILSVVGESGCGKSTLAMSIAGLTHPTSGTIAFDGQNISHLKGPSLKTLRRRIQMIFQDPYESLPPSMTVAQIVAEPLIIHNLFPNPADRTQRVHQALNDAGLTPDTILNRRPDELSGGQRQRVVIAAALVLEPDLLLADEPVSMLDVSIRAGILNLLNTLRRTRRISVLFITHDLSAAAHLSDRIAVMYLGRFVETGPTKTVLTAPVHPYTKVLISVVPIPDPRRRHPWIIPQGDTPDATAIPTGCRFHPRCPVATPECRTQDPKWVSISNQHQAACLLTIPKLL
jgi:oligopeptide/dipeptide ABC transporter ATP-binding protein